MDGFIKMVRVAPIRTKQKDAEEPAPKGMLRERKRRNEKNSNSLLEFLESDTRRLDNQISKVNE